MRRNKLALYLHVVWATWDRLLLIKPEIERRLLRNVESEARKLGCKVLAINCMEDHVHILLAIPTTISIAELVKQMKGVSSHFANDELELDYQFKWQGSYGAFTVSRWDVDKIKQYVKHQKEHHVTGELMPEFEEAFEEFEIDNRGAISIADTPDVIVVWQANRIRACRAVWLSDHLRGRNITCPRRWTIGFSPRGANSFADIPGVIGDDQPQPARGDFNRRHSGRNRRRTAATRAGRIHSPNSSIQFV